MSELLDAIMSNKIYLIVILSILGVIIFFIIKKLTKFLIFGFIVLAAVLAYIIFTSDIKNKAGERVEKAIEKIK